MERNQLKSETLDCRVRQWKPAVSACPSWSELKPKTWDCKCHRCISNLLLTCECLHPFWTLHPPWNCGWSSYEAANINFMYFSLKCLGSPEKVGSVVEVRHPGCLRHHLLEQLPAGSRHLSLLQKSFLFAKIIFFPWFFLPWVIERSDTFDINYMRLGAQETEFQTINDLRWWCWETIPSRSWGRCPLFCPSAMPWCRLIY